MGKNGNQHSSRNSGIFAIKMAYLNALLSFLLSSRRSQLDPKPFKRVIAKVEENQKAITRLKGFGSS